MELLKELRFRLGSARHARSLHKELSSLRRERDALLAEKSTLDNATSGTSSVAGTGTQSNIRIGDGNSFGEGAEALGYSESGNYRRRIGPEGEYDQFAALQLSLLFAAGLRDTHYLADVGCGSLRAGRMLIPYLRPGRYFGVEPEKWLVEKGLQEELGREVLDVKQPSFRFVTDFSVNAFDTQFDFVLSQSVFSHTYPELMRLGFRNIADALAPSGRFFATFVESKTGESEPGVHSDGKVLPNGWIDRGVYRYTWGDLEEALRESGLVGRRLNWPHKNQSWFVACQVDSEAEAYIDTLSEQLRPPRPQWGTSRQEATVRTLHWE